MTPTNANLRPSERPPLSWCGACAACAAATATPTAACGCPPGHGCAPKTTAAPAALSRKVAIVTAAVPAPADMPAPLVCLNSLGARLRHALYYAAPMPLLARLSNRDVLAMAVAMTGNAPAPRPQDAAELSGYPELTWDQALVLVASHLEHLAGVDDYARSTVDKIVIESGRLAGFMCDGPGKLLVADVTTEDLRLWSKTTNPGPRRRGLPPAKATVRLRLTSARILFTVLRRLGLYAGDPLAGVKGPGRSKRATRPMRDDEIMLLRLSCNDIDGSYLHAAAVALCEATATTTELSAITARHIHLDTATVELVGAKRRLTRIGRLSTWGARQVAARIAWLEARHPGENIDELPLTYTGQVGGPSGGASAAALMRGILERAGLAGQGGIKAGSIAAAYGRRVWKQTHEARLVAHALGIRSLDAALDEIGVDKKHLPDNAEELLRAAVLGDGHGTINALHGAARPGKKKPAPAGKKRKAVKVTAVRIEAGAL